MISKRSLQRTGTLVVTSSQAAAAARWNEITTLVSIVLVEGAFFFVLPAFPDFVRELGVQSPAEVASWTGTLIGVTPVLAALAGPWWGRVGDRFGIWLMALRSTLALTLIWTASAFVRSPGELLVLRLLLGVTGGYQTLVVALATQGCAPERTGRVIARIQITQILTVAAAPAAGGVLARLLGVRGLLLTAAAMCLTALVGFLLFYRDRGAARPPAGEAAGESVFVFRLAPGVGWMAVLLFLAALIDRSFQPATVLFAAHLAPPGESARLAGLLMSVGAAGDGFAAWYCGNQGRRPDLWPLIVARAGAGMAACFALFWTGSAATFLAGRVLYALGAGGMQTLLYTAASRRIPEAVRTSQFALLASCFLFGTGAGALLTGVLSAWRVNGVFMANAAWFAVLIAVARAARRHAFNSKH